MSAAAGQITDYQLRFCPASYIHSRCVPPPLRGWLDGLPGWRQQSSINAWLLEELSLSTDYAVPPGLGHVAFFDLATLEQIMALLGAMLHGKAIRQLMDAKSLLPVHAAIGEAGHRFCLQQLDYIIGPWPPGWQQALPAHELCDYFRHCGLLFWLFAIGDANEGLARRLALRVPESPCKPSLLFNPREAELARALCLKIARHVRPECLDSLK